MKEMEAPDYSAAVLRVRKANGHYAVLGVARGADAAAIKRAYKTQAILVHPDRNDQPGAEEAFKSVLEAYVVLSDARHRALYDDEQDGRRAAHGATAHKRKQYERPPTAEEVAIRREREEMLRRAFEEERHVEWVNKGRREQSFLLVAVLGMVAALALGTFGFILFLAWPDDDGATYGTQASRLSVYACACTCMHVHAYAHTRSSRCLSRR